jgi:(2R)-sulfolactate sulfo-lyase subunit beta
MEKYSFSGYRRENGSVACRNHVAIIPVDDISNAACEGVASLISGTLCLSHPYGRLQFGEDLELFFRMIIGTGCNPNIASVVVIGIEPNWTKKIADGIARTGKPVESFFIERSGDLKTIEKASRAAMKLMQKTSMIQREEIDLSEVTISTKCGESDTTSGLASNPTVGKVFERLIAEGSTLLFGETSELTGSEQFVADRMKTPELKKKFMKIFDDYTKFIEDQDADLLGSQPTQGNIAGGLTTIEEKAMGNIQKIGNAMVDGVLSPAESPTGKGLWYMDTSSAAAECVTLFAAGGSIAHLFTTGQGNIVGNPVIPVIKMSANPITVSTMSEHIDVPIEKILTLEQTLDEAGDATLDMLIKTLSGRLTAAEVLRHKEFVLTKLYRSA